MVNIATKKTSKDKKQPSKDDLTYPYNMIAEMVNMETAELMYEQFGGQQVTFPVRFVTAEALNADIMADYENGVKIPDLVRKYRVSESMVRRLITRERKKLANPEPPPKIDG